MTPAAARRAPESSIAAARRLWTAAWALDELLGHQKASEWAADRVADLRHAGRLGDGLVIGRLADTLERRLAREQGRAT